MERLYDHTFRRQQAQITAMQSQIDGLVHHFGDDGKALAPAGETTIIGDNVTVVRDNQIIINIFGQESVDHVTTNDIKEVLDAGMQIPELSAGAMQSVLRAAMLVYSDPTHPENLTCFIPNKREGGALVHGQKGWEVQPLQVAAHPMAAKGMDLLFDKQPFEDAAKYKKLMAELRDNEARYVAGGQMRTILIRNKALLDRALAGLPIAGDSPRGAGVETPDA